MCFSVPIKIVHVNKTDITLENGEKIKREKKIIVKPGQYVRLTGSIIHDYLSEEDGDSIRKLIEELQINYE